jgi:elongator complex protein 3
LAYTLTIVPPWTRINRVHRDFPKASEKNYRLGYESETIKTNLNQLVHNYLDQNFMKCHDIRKREIKNMLWENKNEILNRSRLYVRHYDQFDGREYFISVEIPKSENDMDDAILLGFIRLRVLFHHLKDGISIIKDKKIARVRELHVYGYISNTQNKNVIQHSGIGTFLLKMAEMIAYHYHDCEKMMIISGIGVRNYYRRFGYELSDEGGEYMMKKLSSRYFISFHHKYYLSWFLFGWHIYKKCEYLNGKGFGYLIYSISEKMLFYIHLLINFFIWEKK